MVVITIIGTLFIVISAILTFLDGKDRGLLTNIFATSSGAVGGVLVGIGITGIINLDPLEKISDEIASLKNAYNDTQRVAQFYEKVLDEISVAKVSSENRKDYNKKLVYLSSKPLYRYFETLNKNGLREWRMKEILFSVSADKRRITAPINYKTRNYHVHAACIGNHLLYISEEIDNLDQPMIDIYFNLRIDPTINSSGISIRHPWEPGDKLICSYAILSEKFLLGQSEWDYHQDGGYWILKDNQNEDKLKIHWCSHNGNVNCFVQTT